MRRAEWGWELARLRGLAAVYSQSSSCRHVGAVFRVHCRVEWPLHGGSEVSSFESYDAGLKGETATHRWLTCQNSQEYTRTEFLSADDSGSLGPAASEVPAAVSAAYPLGSSAIATPSPVGLLHAVSLTESA